jgi:NADPH-dependent F420 reductase
MTGPVALLGGTGDAGVGLALRLSLAGVPILLGSRSVERAEAAASDVVALSGPEAARVRGVSNRDAAEGAEVVILTLPFDGLAGSLQPLAAALAGKTVISTVVPMTFTRGVGPAHVEVEEGSAAQLVARLLPDSSVAGAFHNISAVHLRQLDHRMSGDVIVTADSDEAREHAAQLVRAVDGLRPVNGGALRFARYTEQLTVLLLSINRIHKAHAGVAITELPEALPD